MLYDKDVKRKGESGEIRGLWKIEDSLTGGKQLCMN